MSECDGTTVSHRDLTEGVPGGCWGMTFAQKWCHLLASTLSNNNTRS